MKITKSQLKRIIKEELEASLDEGGPGYGLPSTKETSLEMKVEKLKIEVDMIKARLEMV
jgi:hypothetical protein